MCGICGVLFPTADVHALVAGMASQLSHRGPDGEGVEVLPDGVLGHRRLAVIDLSPAAAQPMWDLARTVCVTFNGEIYNFRELRRECEQAGVRFSSASDTEVVACLYRLHGTAAFARLNGMFALCLYDAAERSFWLVRDPVGIKPLYWAQTPLGTVFASELKALLRTGAVGASVDPAALQAFLQLDYVPAPMSIVRGVHKLREGHLLRVVAGESPIPRRYYQSAVDAMRTNTSFTDDVAELGSTLRRAVERQLVADVPVGVFLSGGIDSSLVALAATEVASSRVSTFSIGFSDPSFDESRYFSAVASALGTDHHVETVGPRTLVDLVPQLPELTCEPLADGSIFPTALLARFTRKHVTVALSGDGADELFAGYPTYRASRLAELVRNPLARWHGPLTRALDALVPVSFANLSFEYRLKKLVAGFHTDPILRNARWLGTFMPEELPGLLEEYHDEHQFTLEALLHEPAKEVEERAPLERLLRTDQRFYMQDQVLVKVDRASMLASLEVRPPFLDLEMVAFARSLPPDRKLAGGRTKAILKAWGRGRLPESVLRRPKKGFGTPLGRAFRHELRELLGDTLSNTRLRAQGFFRPEPVGRLLEDHWRGRRDNRKQLFNLLAFTLWWESYGQGGTRAARAS
jgi:asparagine synthase (glutamine-hydrolysing)